MTISETAFIATNMSSYMISEMTNALICPERFGGMHFYNPLIFMPLVEVVGEYIYQ